MYMDVPIKPPYGCYFPAYIWTRKYIQVPLNGLPPLNTQRKSWTPVSLWLLIMEIISLQITTPLPRWSCRFVMMAYRLALGPDCSLSPALSVVTWTHWLISGLKKHGVVTVPAWHWWKSSLLTETYRKQLIHVPLSGLQTVHSRSISRPSLQKVIL